MDEAVLKELTEELENMGYDIHDAEVWYNLGSELYNSNHLTEAETSFRQSINLDPSNAQAWCDLGATLFLQNRFDEAESAFKGGLEHDNEDSDIWV